MTVGRPIVDDKRLELFNRHKLERLAQEPTTASHYTTGWL